MTTKAPPTTTLAAGRCSINFVVPLVGARHPHAPVPHLRGSQSVLRMTTRPVAAGPSGASEADDSLDQERQRLQRMMNPPTITGDELRQLVLDKWNRQYDVRLTKRGRRMYLQVFWKFLGQKSFPLTEEEYNLQLDAVAEYLTLWGVADTVRAGIISAKWAPGMTIGELYSVLTLEYELTNLTTKLKFRPLQGAVLARIAFH